MQYTGRLLLETVARQALVVLYDGLNTMISNMNTTWAAEDDALMAALGRPPSSFTVETIAAGNFYPGTIPSLINAPIDKYPNVSATCYKAEPKVSSDDMGENYTHTLAIEIMCKSGFFETGTDDLTGGILVEQEVNSRINKTLDAAHLTILENRTLSNTIPALPAPRVSVGDLFIRRLEKGQGPRWYWQGGALEYNLDKYVHLM